VPLLILGTAERRRAAQHGARKAVHASPPNWQKADESRLGGEGSRLYGAQRDAHKFLDCLPDKRREPMKDFRVVGPPGIDRGVATDQRR
jgi:hypothetical protein